jgi:hypothetical protein
MYFYASSTIRKLSIVWITGQMWITRQEMGFSEHLIDLLRELYNKQEATVRTEFGETDSFKIGKGLRQGCPLSPTKFNVYAERVMKRAGMEEADEGLRIGGRKVNNLRYADDTTLLAANITDLQNLIRKVKTSSEEAGLFLNIKKTKIMSTTKLQGFKLDNEELEVVSRFPFLGSTIKEDGDCREDINKRLALGRAAVIGLDKIWKGKDVKTETKVRLMEALVFPVAMYGAESWTTRKADIKKIEAFENWSWRKMLRISWKEKRTNASIQQ